MDKRKVEDLLTEDEINYIKSIINEHNDLFKSAYAVGSFCLPWINNPHDRDVVLFTNKNMTTAQANELFKELAGGKNYNLSLLVNSKDSYKYKYATMSFIIYQLPYSSFIAGEEQSFNVDIFTDNFKAVFKKDVNRAHNNKINKGYYHLLTIYYMLKNNSTELTAEQILNINKVHDDYLSEETNMLMQEVWEYCDEYED